MKHMTPNYEILKQSTITAMQNTYAEWKKAVVECFKYTFINDNGELSLLDGQEERNAKAAELWKELQRLQLKLKEIKGEMNEN